MQKRGVGNKSGRELSAQRGEAIAALEQCLADVPFPTQIEELFRLTEGTACFTAPNGTAWSLRDLLTGVPVREFSSAQHVSEVVRLRWEDMADLFRPGGTGSHEPYGPSEDIVAGHATERAVAAHDEATGGEKDSRAGP